MSTGDPVVQSSLNGGGGGAIVGSGSVTIPSGSKVVAYTSFSDTATVTTAGQDQDLSAKIIPKGVTIFGRWTTFTGNSADQGYAYFG